MAFTDQIKRGPTLDPFRVLLHGQEGVGKTTWAAGAPKALFLTAEDGGGVLDYERIVCPTWQSLLDAVDELGQDAHGFQTVVLDTIDAFEGLLWDHLCRRAKTDSIEEIGGGYGKGYTRAAEAMADLRDRLDRLRRVRQVHVILLAHSHVKAFNDPMGAPYDRYEVRMHKSTAALWLGWADCVLFAAFEATVKQAKRNATVLDKGKAESARRVVYTSKDAAFDAKNRHNLPDELPLKWAPFAKAISWERKAAHPGGEGGNVAKPDTRRPIVEGPHLELRNLYVELATEAGCVWEGEDGWIRVERALIPGGKVVTDLPAEKAAEAATKLRGRTDKTRDWARDTLTKAGVMPAKAA